MKTYTELSQLKTYEERLDYLKLDGSVGEDTFGFDRYINQNFYKSKEWKAVRNKVVTRDLGCDLGIEDRPIPEGVNILIHHMNPITKDDIANSTDNILNPEYLICVTHPTHNRIHYEPRGNCKSTDLKTLSGERSKNDTSPWKRQ